MTRSPIPTSNKLPVAPRQHREEVRELQAAADAQASLDGTLSGSVVTEKQSKIGIGVAQIVTTTKSQTYRTNDAMLVDCGDRVEDAQWMDVRGNTSLRCVLGKYGADLLGYDACRSDTSIEVFSWEIFATSAKSVRVLVRQARFT